MLVEFCETAQVAKIKLMDSVSSLFIRENPIISVSTKV